MPEIRQKQVDVAKPGGSGPIFKILPKTSEAAMDEKSSGLLLRFFGEERKSRAFAGEFIIYSLPTHQKTLSFASFLFKYLCCCVVKETRMRDRFTLYARGGEGGSGCSSARRTRADRYGKPDGTISLNCYLL